jgi:lysyl-tRNA synthetase, class II
LLQGPEHLELREIRLEKAKALEALGQGPYALNFAPTHNSAELQAAHADLANGEERDLTVLVAGRVITRRVMGKLAFFTLLDGSGSIQLYLEKSSLDADSISDPAPFAQLTTLVATCAAPIAVNFP